MTWTTGTITHHAAIREPGDPGYPVEAHPRRMWVLEDDRGEWVADLAAPLALPCDVEQIEHHVRGVLGVRVEATPTGGNITGDATHRNPAVTSTEWAIATRPAAQATQRHEIEAAVTSELTLRVVVDDLAPWAVEVRAAAPGDVPSLIVRPGTPTEIVGGALVAMVRRPVGAGDPR